MTLIICAAIIAAGSIAWFSATQRALNEFTFNPEGVNLHDDFTEPNKDVYVENSGVNTLLVRVKLREYMEIGSNIKIPDDDDVTREDKTTWPYHNGVTEADLCEIETEHVTNDNGDPYRIHDYWQWIMGGRDSGYENAHENGQKWYVPAIPSQALLGAYGYDEEEPPKGWKDWEDNVVAKTKVLEDGLPATLTQYDDYADLLDNIDLDAEIDADSGDTLGDYLDKLEIAKLDLKIASLNEDVEGIHRERKTVIDLQKKINEYTRAEYGLQLTRPAEVISILDWDGTLGDFWIIDTDGWCYWAMPLEPGEATGLLLDAVIATGAADLVKNRTRYYYGIDVSMQAATFEDVEEFWNENNPDIGNSEKASGSAQALLIQMAASIDLGEAYVASPATTSRRGAKTLSTPRGAAAEETAKGRYWYLSGDVWRFYDGRWRYDGQEWTLNGEEYDFNPNGWMLVDGEWYYIDDDWFFDGNEWTYYGDAAASKPPPEEDPIVAEPEPDVSSSESEGTGASSETGGQSGGDEPGDKPGDKPPAGETGGESVGGVPEDERPAAETDTESGSDTRGDTDPASEADGSDKDDGEPVG